MKSHDAYGQLLLDCFKKRRGREVVEHKDGLIDPSETLVMRSLDRMSLLVVSAQFSCAIQVLEMV